MNYKLSETKVNNKAGIKLIAGQFWQYKRQLGLIIFCLLISTTASVFIPQLLKYAIDEAIAKSDLPKLWFLTINSLFLLAVMGITFVFQMRLTGQLAQKVLLQLRAKVFAKLQDLPMAFFSENQSGDIIQRLTGNVEGINSFFSEGFVRLTNILFSLLGFLTVMFLINSTLGLIVLASVLLVVLYLTIQGNILGRRLKKSLDNEGELSSQTQEILNGYQIIKIYEKEQEFLTTFQTKNLTLYKSILSANFISALSDGILPFIFSVATFIIILVALNFYSAGVLTKGDIIVYLTYLITFYRRFDGISGLWNNIQSGLASAARINELLNLPNNVAMENPIYSPTAGQIKGKVEFRQVDFSYDTITPVLNNINLSVEPGQTIAIVGPTGGGKTSFVSLIARLYDVSAGEILVDDINVKNWDLNALRTSIGYLIQESIFFSGTIWANLTYDNPNISKDKVMQVITDLGGNSLIASLPDGLQTIITSDSKLLSSGQKQILALTRLILRDPKILILDEATSNIDTQSEKIIQNAINLIRKGKTTFIIAHRLSTIFNADKIILIQNNTILESGTHEELLALKGRYYGIYSKFIDKVN